MPLDENTDNPDGTDQLFSQAAAQNPPTDTTTTPSTPPPAETPAAQPTPQQLSAAFEAAQQLGIDVTGYQDEQSLIADLYKQAEDARRSYSEAQPYVDYARQVLPYDEQIRQVVQGQAVPQAQPAAPEPVEEEWSLDGHFNKAWSKPQYDKAWEAFISSGMVVMDPESRQFVPAERYASQVPAQVLQGLNGRISWQRDALEKLLENPYQQTWEAFQEPIQRLVDEKVQSILRQQEQVSYLDSWEQQNAKLLYETTADGQVIYDPFGNPRPTAYGQTFLAAVQELRPLGDNRKILQLAGQIAAAQVAAQGPPAPVNGNGSAAPTLPAQAAAAAPTDQSFLGQALEKARHRPSSGAYAEGVDIDPMVQTTMELEDVFRDAARKAGVR